MSIRRLAGWMAVFISVALAALGFIVFVLGVLIELADGITEPLDPYISPVAQMSLAGLCLSASMILLGFLLVGVLLARQSRQYGAGYGEAYRLMQKFKFPEAIQLLERVLAGGKITPDLLMLLTSAYAYNGQLAKAQETADQAVRMFPRDAGAYMTLANGYRMQASYGEAAIALQTAAQLSPAQPIIWAELGFVQQLAGEHDSAMESFKHAALYSMPSMYAVRVNYYLSRHYLKVGEREDAERASERMVATEHGLQAWKSTLRALEGTAYGSLLNYEIEKIEEAIAETGGKRKNSG
jgi:tetratricopeptide (TPR) repeat protein